MAGNARFELSSTSPDSGFVGSYPNGQRGSYAGPTLDRSGSFRDVREGADNRIFGSGKVTSRGVGASMGDLPPLSQCLMLDPIVMGEQKYTRSGELRRVLGFSVGSTSEDNSFGATHLKAPVPVAMEELKRFRASIAETCNKASGRAKRLDEHLHKLNKLFEAMGPKKQQRSDLLSNERAGGSSLKMAAQIHRSPSDTLTHKSDDRPKNVLLNKRVRTSVAETRPELRNNGLPRQPLMMSRDRDMLKDTSADPDMAEEKIRRLPAGGESWDKKMKRKRSGGTVFSRPVDSDGDAKRVVHHKVSNEPGFLSPDSHGFRSGASNGAGGISKSDGMSPASSIARATFKSDQEKPSLTRDLTAGLNKERGLAKGSIKLNSREENHAICPSPVTKGKASRAPRSGSTVPTNATPNILRTSGTLESWDQPSGVNKNLSAGGANSRKRPLPPGSSSPPKIQWKGQRPQKMSRTRRANLVSPVSNHEEMQISSEGCSPSDFGVRAATNATNGSFLPKSAASGTQNFKVKPESVSSPARLSESEESGAGESRLKEKGVGNSEVEEKVVNAVQNAGPSAMLTKKNKFLIKEDIGDGVRRQGRSGRGASFSRGSISPGREKLDNVSTIKPVRSVKPGSDKNGSKSGRPLKKLSDRKGFSRLGHSTNSGSPDFTGESDDDREELVAAANSAFNSSSNACSSIFWKKVEPLFAPICSEEKSYLSEQLKLAEQFQENLDNNVQDDNGHEEICISGPVSGERMQSLQNHIGSKDSADTAELVNQFRNSSILGKLDSDSAEKLFDKVTPLYQRVLSSLIIEDETEDFEENGFARYMSTQSALVNSPDDAGPIFDAEIRNRDGMVFECESVFAFRFQTNGKSNRFLTCNGSGIHNRSPGLQEPHSREEMLQGDSEYLHSEVGMLVGLSRCDINGPQSLQKNNFGTSSFDCQYDQMSLSDRLLLELQSVGLYPENVPGLDDKEDEVIDQEIAQLQKGLYQQIGKKKTCLDKISKAVQEGKDAEKRDPEQIAMNKLVELAYKKLLATRGSLASKNGVAKVSKPVALAFARRTLARCRKFEDSGSSCFSESHLRDIIFALPSRVNEELPGGAGVAVANGSSHGADVGSLDGLDTFSHHSDQAFAKNGPISNRGKKKEVLLDDVGGGAAFRASSNLSSSLLGGAKGKRSERDRDRDTSVRGAVAKAGRSSLGNSKGERKKQKPKQKTAQLSTSGNGFLNKYVETIHPIYPCPSGSADSLSNAGNRKREVGLMSPGNNPLDSSKEAKESTDFPNLPLNEIPIEEFGEESDLGGPQDLNSWFNFDVDGLQDHDSIGLDIPMDDLSELNMF